MRFKKLGAITCFWLILALFGGGCSEKSLQEVKDERSRISLEELQIVIAGPKEYMEKRTLFVKGVELAAQKANEERVLGEKKVKLVIRDDKGTFMDGIALAREIAQNPEISAVVGHWHSHITLPAAELYNEAGVLMLTPVVSNPALTKEEYDYIFRNIPSDSMVAKEMAAFAKKKGYERIVVYYADNPYGKGLADAFEDVSREIGLKVVDRVNLPETEQAWEKARAKWQALDYQAVFIADSMPEAEKFITELKKYEPQIPMLGGDGLDFAEFTQMGDKVEGSVIASLSNSKATTPALKDFKKEFSKKYGVEPDGWAQLGYEAVWLITLAAQETGSVAPQDLAKAFKSEKKWPGLFGKISFDALGEVEGKQVYKKQVQDGTMIYLP